MNNQVSCPKLLVINFNNCCVFLLYTNSFPMECIAYHIKHIAQITKVNIALVKN